MDSFVYQSFLDYIYNSGVSYSINCEPLEWMIIDKTYTQNINHKYSNVVSHCVSIYNVNKFEVKQSGNDLVFWLYENLSLPSESNGKYAILYCPTNFVIICLITLPKTKKNRGRKVIFENPLFILTDGAIGMQGG